MGIEDMSDEAIGGFVREFVKLKQEEGCLSGLLQQAQAKLQGTSSSG